MQGKIIKGIAGFYYVNVEGIGIVECKAKGIFRKDGIKPLVGDDVRLEILDEGKLIGNIAEILKRKNEMIRPACANVDGALIIFSIKSPNPNFNLLDRFLIYMDSCNIKADICFNKDDLSDENARKDIEDAYRASGYRVIFVSGKKREGIDELFELIRGKTTVVAGPSGVGKSTLINCLCNDNHMQTGSISVKNERGKHTTRHSELMYVCDNTYIMDTPGFTSLDVFEAKEDTLKYYYDEFSEYNDMCRFRSCMHISEPDCAVKDAVSKGLVSRLRYDNYSQILKEIKGKTKY